MHGPFAGIEDAQAALDAWRKEYNTARPHQPLDMAFPSARFTRDMARDPAALELLREQRNRLTDRIRPPWWYLTGSAIAWAVGSTGQFSLRFEVEVSGRHRYYRLSGPHVAAVLETLATIAPLQPIRSLRQDTRAGQLRTARSCYDHLGGRLGVAVTAALLNRRVLTATDGMDDTTRRPGDRLSAALPTHPYQLGPVAADVLGNLGVDLPALLQAPRSARLVLRFCSDWTEQRHHLAGALGAALLNALCDSGCLIRRSQRVIWLTEHGAETLHEYLGLDPSVFRPAGHGPSSDMTS